MLGSRGRYLGGTENYNSKKSPSFLSTGVKKVKLESNSMTQTGSNGVIKGHTARGSLPKEVFFHIFPYRDPL